MSLTRRDFLALGGALAAAWAAGQRPPAGGPGTGAPEGPLVDFHVHLFGVGDGGTGCFLSGEQKRHWNYRYFLRLLGLRENGRMDQDYLEVLSGQLRASSIQRAVLLAQDCRYDGAGKPDRERTACYVPNDYLFQAADRFPDLFIPCASINPRRRDALEELERCAARGARVVKIHPPTQDVDPGEERFRPFYRLCAERRMVVMVHTGAEHAAPIVGHQHCDPGRLTPALEEGCTVVAAHAGMGSFFDGLDFFPSLREMVRRFPSLYCDSAVLASMFRWRNLPRLLAAPEVLGRLVHASDFPFPPNALVFWNRLSPSRLLDLCSERNLIERDFRLKLALGLPAAVFERGARLLGLRR